MDRQQVERVSVLQQQADEVQLVRDLAKDQFDIALYWSQQPNRYRWRQQTVALLAAGISSVGGTLYALDRQALYGVPLATGAGLSIGLAAKALDDRRQTREKQQRLSLNRYELHRAETQLRQVVADYRDEEEIGWLMYALNTSKPQILALREWMGDPRRTMKDNILEAIDIVSTRFLQDTLDPDPIHRLTLERQYRQLRQRLFSPDLQLQKDGFLAQVFAKHHLLRDQELQLAAAQADIRIKATAAAGGTTAGLLTGAGIATTLGSSKAAIAHAVTSAGSAAAALGVGLLAAGSLHRWMIQNEGDRRQREAQQFHDAFMITTQIFEEIVAAQTLTEPNEQRQRLQKAQDYLNAFKKQALKSQDRQLKQYADVLGDRLKRYLQPQAERSYLGQFMRRLKRDE
ncbi:MAG: hypothetical protein WCD18_00280 [Thermosynechococcaceae cyanobacterium]